MCEASLSFMDPNGIISLCILGKCFNFGVWLGSQKYLSGMQEIFKILPFIFSCLQTRKNTRTSLSGSVENMGKRPARRVNNCKELY